MSTFRSSASLLVVLLVLVAIGSVGARAQESAEQPADAQAEPGIEVAESAVCTQVEDRAPVGTADRFPASVDRLYCFTELRGAAGSTVVHAWIHEGTTRARVELEVRGDRWRTWSSKQILPEWTGQWEVKVLTAEGAVLHTVAFTVE